jgi:hypothetical protein
MSIFGHWCDGVVDLIKSTPEEDVLRRDIYDRVPIMEWTKGRVALLGDSAHAMQPNMGQGGCMAIEVKSIDTIISIRINITSPWFLFFSLTPVEITKTCAVNQILFV